MDKDNIVGKHVFISFSSDDKVYADKIIEYLKKHDIPIWVDYKDLVPGTEDWDRAIKDAINNSSIVLFLVSPNSGASPYVKGEIAIAKSKQIKIFPVWIAGDSWEDCAPIFIIGMQYLDLRGNIFNRNITQLCDFLIPFMNEPVKEPVLLPEKKKKKQKQQITKKKSIIIISMMTIVALGTVIFLFFIVPNINKIILIPVPQDLVLVDAGSFQMGSDDSYADTDEKPVHEVRIINDFYMGKYEVAFSEYDVFCIDTGRERPDDNGWGRALQPVINVSWEDAVAYCNWKSDQKGYKRCYKGSGSNVTCDFSNNGYRLPTEAEWEYAARGGIRSTIYIYAGSNNPDEVAWYANNSGDIGHPVGQKNPNELGLYDMSGNVWEWCWDWYDKYPESTDTNDAYASGYRVLRGGSWYDKARINSLSNRNWSKPGNKLGNWGFRLAATAK